MNVNEDKALDTDSRRGRNGFIDNRPYIETVFCLGKKYVALDDSERSVIAEAADRFPHADHSVLLIAD